MINRRKFLGSSIAAAIAAGAPMGWVIREAGATPACGPGTLGCTTPRLSDPTFQFNGAGFVTTVPDAMAPSFKYIEKNGQYAVQLRPATQMTGLLGPGGAPVATPVWGYADKNDAPKVPTWPGKTFEVQSSLNNNNPQETIVKWSNGLEVNNHLLPVDTSAHWCYSLPGYEQYSIARNGIPIITHLHGGNSDFQFDGNPEFFYNPYEDVLGPQWALAGGFTNKFRYNNNVPAGSLWYHDHALGITRLNVYAGLAGFYIVRDDMDTGLAGNPMDLPAWPYEKLYAIQDRMFLETGELFYPALPGDPYYADFIDGEGAVLPSDLFPNGGPTALAEFFGDHMVVNGVIWPKEDVEPRNYRMRLLNGTDSRFMALQFFAVEPGQKNFANATGPLPFTVIGSDQGLASAPTTVPRLVSEPGSRYDIIFDFGMPECAGKRIIMKNVGGDEPFGGDIPGPRVFQRTNRVMAFDVTLPINALSSAPDVSPVSTVPTAAFGYNIQPKAAVDRVRNVALFEGKDEFGRLQPLLGTAQPARDHLNNVIRWPDTPVYRDAVLADGTPSPLRGAMQGSIAWHSPTTENPALDSTERWNIWNVTGDAHPVHLHLVNFEIVGRRAILWDSNTIEEGEIVDGMPSEEDRVIPNAKALAAAEDGTYLEVQPTVQHNSVPGDPATYGMGFRIVNRTFAKGNIDPGFEYVENAPKDMVTALPNQVTIIKAKFDKPGRYVWHCHILSHEDHEMMRVMHVGPGA